MAVEKIAKGLASLGRNGDSVLVHMHPAEVAGLQALAKSQGTSLTVNPHTGMPEAFNLMNALGSLAPTLVGLMLAGPAGGAIGETLGAGAASAAPIVGGALTGAALAGAKGENPLLGGVMGGFGGYGGGNLANSIASFGAPTAATAAPTGKQLMDLESAIGPSTNMPYMPPAPTAPPMESLGLTGSTGELGPNMGLVNKGGYNPFNPPSTVDLTQSAGVLPEYAGAEAAPSPFMTGAQEVMNRPMDFLKANAYGVGMPLGMAALSGLEQSDLYPTIKTANTDKYDPYKTLNLSGSTGLRLMAEGGLTSGGLSSLYANPDGTVAQNTPAEGYGAYRLDTLAKQYNPGFARGGYLDGPGDGMSDSIPATIAGKQPARLADGEFVVPADVVSHLGNGSTKAGAKQLYKMMDKVRQARTGTTKQGREINPHKLMPV